MKIDQRLLIFIVIITLFTLFVVINYDYFLLFYIFATKKDQKLINSIPNNGNTISPQKFEKYRSVTPLVRFLFDMQDLKPDDTRIGVFTRNLEFREVDELGNNLIKRQYYSALDVDKVETNPRYDVHQDALLQKLETDSQEEKPFLSSFSSNLVSYYLNIHLGTPNSDQEKVPNKVYDFFNDILDIAGKGQSFSMSKIFLAVKLKRNAKYVRDYFAIRIDEIQRETPMNESYIVTNWLKAGFKAESVLVAAFHNIIAFSQFLHTCYLILNHDIMQTDTSNKYINRYNVATDENAKKRVIYDIFREQLPNDGSLSRIRDSDRISKHVHRKIQESVDPNGSLYDTQISSFLNDPYPYQNISKCPFFNSPLDNQTVIPCGAEKTIPVFQKPIYMPFGLGYRRCAGELLSYRFIGRFLLFMNDFTVEKRDNKDKISVGPDRYVRNDIYIVKNN